MKQLKDIPSEEAAILASLRECVARIQQLIAPAITDVSSGVFRASFAAQRSRRGHHQLKHAALVLEAARHIQSQRPETASLDWYWHPFQTGGIDEPDLQARSGSEVVISAEATASECPDGAIDTRMAHTLKKLQAMPGERFYFVRTESMQQRAQTKVQKAGYAISIATIRNA